MDEFTITINVESTERGKMLTRKITKNMCVLKALGSQISNINIISASAFSFSTHAMSS